MKKLLVLAIGLLLLLTCLSPFIGCGEETMSPEEVVNRFLVCLDKGNFETAQEFYSGKGEIDFDAFESAGFMDGAYAIPDSVEYKPDGNASVDIQGMVYDEALDLWRGGKVYSAYLIKTEPYIVQSEDCTWKIMQITDK